MKLTLIRHANTHHNKNNIISGHTQTRLTPEGVQQAKLLGKRLKKEKIDAIYSSDLIRTVQTANEIIKYHPKLKLHKLKALRERNFGSFERKYSSTVDWNKIPSNLEKTPALRKRAVDAIKKIYKKHKGQNVVIVAHGSLNRAFLTYALNKPAKYFFKLPSIPNTGISIIKFTDKGLKVEKMNCAKHLEK